ncbi:PREDICTED: cytochrome P450 CYP82D47-like [Tarenaya hassleriana]|uniref:cytochrome P450 CYP82D47-like n=1 Tax=Tarenaya hassleriana TaxID=28532 RepID=UPI00053C617D|nr:PREDICTED: cytochrome P450 CYP82D47-like [Tarenaya hassleriana]
MDSTLFLVVTLLLSFSSIFVIPLLFGSNPNKKRCNVPEVAGAWPLIGHLPIYNTRQLTHVTLGALADAYGPIFATKLGSLRLLIISGHDIARECYTVHDKSPTRPPLMASKLVGYDHSFLTFCPYGPYWRELRKLTITELLSTYRLDMLERSRVVEADIAFGDIYRRWEGNNKVVVDMSREFHDLTANISLMMLSGKRYFGESHTVEEREAKKCRKLVRDFRDYFGLYLFSDFLPGLGWLLDWPIKRAMKRTAKDFDEIIESWVAEHRMKKKDRDEDKDYLDLLIEFIERSKIPGLDAHKTIKALCLELVFATSETATVILVWAVALLLNNPRTLKKAREELDSVVGGKTRLVQESDIKDLVYIQAIVKETFRLYPPVPFLSLRTVQEDFEIASGNYHVPVGTRLLVNAWKIQRDPSLWPDPDRFEPERFLAGQGKDVGLGGQSFKLLPFGMGKRSCPGIPLALRMLHYPLARFLHSFDLATPSNQDVDMTETNGLVNNKATPLSVLITPRLHPSLYYRVDHVTTTTTF